MFICHGNGWSFVQSGNFGVGELCFIIITMNKFFLTIRFSVHRKVFFVERCLGQSQLMLHTSHDAFLV